MKIIWGAAFGFDSSKILKHRAIFCTWNGIAWTIFSEVISQKLAARKWYLLELWNFVSRYHWVQFPTWNLSYQLQFWNTGRYIYMETVDHVEYHFRPEHDTLCNIKNQKLPLWKLQENRKWMSESFCFDIFRLVKPPFSKIFQFLT